MSRVDLNRYQTSDEKIKKVNKRNRYAEDKFKEMTQKFKDDSDNQFHKFNHNEKVKHKKLSNIYNSLHKEWQKNISYKQE
jgi:hypothetical protein